MKVSGREIAQKILQKLQSEIAEKNLKPHLAIILTGEDPASYTYVSFKIKAAQNLNIQTTLFEFKETDLDKCLKTLDKINKNPNIHGVIIQHPVYQSWNFDELIFKVNPLKDVDGFLPDSPFKGATALGVWEMLKAFAEIEGIKFKQFLQNKKIVVLGKGKTAGGPIIRLLAEKGFETTVIDSKTQNSDQIIKSADVVISATGIKHLITGEKIKKGSYVIGVGMEGEEVNGHKITYGDIDEDSIKDQAKLYCPTIGGIGPLTVACLLKNVVSGACLFEDKKVESAKRRN